MSDTAATAIAVLAALAAAASFGVAAALQHRQARLTPQAGGVRLLAAIAGITLLGRYGRTPGLRTAAKHAGAITGPGRSAQAGAAR